MKFLIITDAPTLIKNKNYVAYAPYVNEMDLWMKYCDPTIISPNKYDKPLLVKPFKHSFFQKPIEPLKFNSFSNIFKSLFFLPVNFYKLFKEAKKTDHIHLRCPGNIGLLGCFIQVLFPSKPKTVKYAGNWDPKSKQPLSYRLQKSILSNTFLTRNCKVLVYGNWQNQSKNIKPFFTASYTNKEVKEVPKKSLTTKINFIFVGSFSAGKRPLLSVKVIEELIKNDIENIELNMYGDGAEFSRVKEYIEERKLEKYIFMHGNQQKDIVKEAYIKSHFLIFISKSEGWPKVVAEAMFWGCLPIASKVSCVEDILGYGNRGALLESNCNEKDIVLIIQNYLDNKSNYQQHVFSAKQWSQKYTLDKFELEIMKLL